MPNLGIEILDHLLNFEIRYKGGQRASLGAIVDFVGARKSSVQTSLTRLRKKGYISSSQGRWSMTEKGREFFHDFNLKQFVSPFKKESKKDLLVMFDIPEGRRRYRNWLRDQLREFGYVMVQQSVWVGPSPLPLEFKKYLKELDLQRNIKTFRLAKGIGMI